MSDELQAPVEDAPVPEPVQEKCPFYAGCNKNLADVTFCQRCGYEPPKR